MKEKYFRFAFWILVFALLFFSQRYFFHPDYIAHKIEFMASCFFGANKNAISSEIGLFTHYCQNTSLWKHIRDILFVLTCIISLGITCLGIYQKQLHPVQELKEKLQFFVPQKKTEWKFLILGIAIVVLFAIFER